MSNIKFSKILAVAFTVCFLLYILFSQNFIVKNASAGGSTVYVITSSSVIGDNINGGDFLTDGNIYAQNGAVVFDKNAAQTAHLTAKTNIKNCKEYGLENLLHLSFKINIAKIAADGKVSVAIGLNSVKGEAGSANSAEIVFTYKDACINVGVNEYTKANEPKVVAAATKYVDLDLHSDISVNLEITTSRKAYLSVKRASGQEHKILNGKPFSIDPSGFLSFISYSSETDKNEFKLSEMSASSYKYDVVETVPYYKETFDNGYNKNMFISNARPSVMSPSGIYVEDGVLVFDNCGPAHFTTREQYSNFELKFDIVYLSREGKIADGGDILQLISNWFMIGFGIDNYDSEDYSTATMLQFEHLPLSVEGKEVDHITGEISAEQEDCSNRYVLWVNNTPVKVDPMSTDDGARWSIYDKDKVGEQVINLKYVVMDGKLQLYYKLASESDYGAPQFEYDVGTCDTGYVRIWTYGSELIYQGDTPLKYASVLNMKIDNFEITNLDYEGVRLDKQTPAFETNIVTPNSNFNYTTVTDDSDLLNNKLKKGGK